MAEIFEFGKDKIYDSDSNFSSDDEIEYPMENAAFQKRSSIHSQVSRRSKVSAAESGSDHGRGGDIDGAGKEIIDTIRAKLFFMKYTLGAFAMHISYLVLLTLTNSQVGLVVPFRPDTFLQAAPIIFQVWGVACFIITEMAMTDGLAAVGGYLLSRPTGYSLAYCGYVQSSEIGKLLFPFRLSPTSPMMKPLKAITLFYLVHLAMLFVGLVTSSGMWSEIGTTGTKNKLMCLQYSQVQKPVDRGLPTIEHEIGAIELIDTTAIGRMRSNDFLRTKSNHLFPPQLTDVCVDGSTIKGDGYSTDLESICSCTTTSSASDLSAAGVSSSLAAAAAANITFLNNRSGWINMAAFEASKSEITLSSILTGTGVCPANSVVFCKTAITNHTRAELQVRYKTDGNPASIAASQIYYLSYLGEADMSYLYESLKVFFGGTSVVNILPSGAGGYQINPMFFLMGDNMRNITNDFKTKIEPGLEVAVAQLLRASIQRSYTVAGSSCAQTILDTKSVTIRIMPWAYTIGIFWMAVQLFINFIIALMYLPWFVSPEPLLPAVLFCRDSAMFGLITSKNSVTNTRMKNFGSYVNPEEVWPLLDIVLRFGESVLSAEDPERGVIVLDKPKMVTDLSFEKTYV